MQNFSEIPVRLQTIIQEIISANQIVTPKIIFDQQILEENYIFFKTAFSFDDSCIFYALKANNQSEVIEKLNELNSGFEIASNGELELLKNAKIPAHKIICSNPVKLEQHIIDSYQYGIRIFAFDTENELIKIAKNAPESKLFLRLSISNNGADWKLTDKFGAKRKEVVKLLRKAKEYNLQTLGFSLHLGWNNHKVETWKKIAEEVLSIIIECQRNDLKLEYLNLGGGYPAHNVDQYSMLTQIVEAITPTLSKLRNDFGMKIYAEPGSFLVANTSVVLVRIFDIILRKNKRWVFVDSGIAQGFYWIFGGLKYNIIYPYQISENVKFQDFIITGPTCDTHDIFSKKCSLPENIKTGDFLVIYPAGAYVYSAQNYNGFSYPEVFSIISSI